nr:gastrula zinc finger protein XlCGF57.1-like isoform X4 [Labrus bergylta]
MSSVECLRGFVNERLTAAAEEIFRVFKRTIVEYEEEIDRQRRLLGVVLNPEIKLHRIELPQQHVCKEVEVLSDQLLCNQERNSSLDQEDPEPPQIKEEQEELSTSQEGEQLELKQEDETSLGTPTREDCDNSEPTKRHCQNNGHCNNVYIPNVPHFQINPRSEKKCNSCDTCGKTFKYKSRLQTHVNVHTELPQQHVCKEEEEEEEEEEVLTDQLLCNQERNSSLDQEDPEPPQIKEEQEELSTSQEGEQLELKEMTDALKWTPAHEESDHNEPEKKSDRQPLFHTSHVTEIYDQTPESTESEPQNMCHESNGDSVYNSTASYSNCITHTSTTPFKCDTCGKAFKQKSSMDSHLRIHTGERPYPCSTCGKRFSRMPDLNRHMRIHTGEKPYSCEICGKGFLLNCLVKNHMKIHTGEKPFPCNSCGKRFSRMPDLKRHLRIHTGEKPYTCDTCGRAFRYTGDLLVHTRRAHTGEKPYLCNTCGKRYFDASQLAKHTVLHLVK